MSWRDRAQSRTDPLLRFYWDISIQSPGGVIKPEYVEEVNVPLPKYESDSATFQARKYYFAKFEDFGVTTIKFYEDVNCTVTKWLRAWQQKIKSENGNYKVPTEYKGTITAMAKDPTDATTTTFVMYGVFPTQVPAIPFGSTGDLISLDVEFSIDRVEVK
jgi:hypothetical protein